MGRFMGGSKPRDLIWLSSRNLEMPGCKEDDRRRQKHTMRYPVGASEGFDAAGAPQETDAEAASTNSRDLSSRARWFCQ